MAITMTPPSAPTIDDLLAKQGGSPITTRQDQARQRLLQGISAQAPDPEDRWANVQHALGTAINYWAGHDNLKKAQTADQQEAEQHQAGRRNMAELLMGQGFSPQEAVGLATGSKDQNALVMNLMGMKQDREESAAERAYREQQDQVEQGRFDQQFGLQQQKFNADRADARLANSLRQQAVALGEKEADAKQRQALGRQGHLESIAASLPEDQRALFHADPDGFIAQRQKAENDKFSTEVTRILEANPQLAESEDGVRQAKNIALDLVKSATDPVRGGTATYNLATGVGEPINTPKPELDRMGPGGDPITIDQMAGEVGAVPFAEDVIARTLGQAAPSVVNEARTKAASQLDYVKQKAITAFATSARPPVIEQQRIESLFPSKGIFDSETRAGQQLGHLRDMAVTTHDDYVGLIESGQLPFEQENELRGKVAELRQVVKMLPAATATQSPPALTQSPQEADAGLGDDPLGLFN